MNPLPLLLGMAVGGDLPSPAKPHDEWLLKRGVWRSVAWFNDEKGLPVLELVRVVDPQGWFSLGGDHASLDVRSNVDKIGNFARTGTSGGNYFAGFAILHHIPNSDVWFTHSALLLEFDERGNLWEAILSDSGCSTRYGHSKFLDPESHQIFLWVLLENLGIDPDGIDEVRRFSMGIPDLLSREKLEEIRSDARYIKPVRPLDLTWDKNKVLSWISLIVPDVVPLSRRGISHTNKKVSIVRNAFNIDFILETERWRVLYDKVISESDDLMDALMDANVFLEEDLWDSWWDDHVAVPVKEVEAFESEPYLLLDELPPLGWRDDKLKAYLKKLESS